MTASVGESRTAVIVMAYGGPDCLEAVGPFMRELIGREPVGPMLERIQSRYAQIGGKSPLPEIAADMAAALGARLEADGTTLPVRVGFRYTPPKIGDVLRDFYADGIRHVVAVSLSPFESKATNTAYMCAIDEALPGLPGLSITHIPPLHELDAFVEFHAGELRDALDRLETDSGNVLTVFTAHSLPVEDLESPELYASRLRSVAGDIASRLGMASAVEFTDSARLPGIASFGAPDSGQPWLLAYQSKGQRPGEWLGPDIEDVMNVAAEVGFAAIAVSPIGFATEHMETRYDLDIVEANRARDLAIAFDRGVAPNDARELIAHIARAVADAAAGPLHG